MVNWISNPKPLLKQGAPAKKKQSANILRRLLDQPQAVAEVLRFVFEAAARKGNA